MVIPSSILFIYNQCQSILKLLFKFFFQLNFFLIRKNARPNSASISIYSNSDNRTHNFICQANFFKGKTIIGQYLHSFRQILNQQWFCFWKLSVVQFGRSYLRIKFQLDCLCKFCNQNWDFFLNLGNMFLLPIYIISWFHS